MIVPISMAKSPVKAGRGCTCVSLSTGGTSDDNRNGDRSSLDGSGSCIDQHS